MYLQNLCCGTSFLHSLSLLISERHRKFLRFFSLLSFLKVNYDFFQELCLQKKKDFVKDRGKNINCLFPLYWQFQLQKMLLQRRKKASHCQMQYHIGPEVSSTFAVPPTFLPQQSPGRVHRHPLQQKKSDKITITRQIKRSHRSDSYRSGIIHIQEGKGAGSGNRKLEGKLHFPLFLPKRWTFPQNVCFQNKGCIVRCWFDAFEIMDNKKTYKAI